MENLSTSLYKPVQQLVFYKGDREAYVELFEILQSGGKQVLSEGVPLTKQALKKMLDMVISTDSSVFATVKELLPENVIYYDPRPGKIKLMWYAKAGEKVLHGIYKNEVKAKLPAILYCIDGDKLSVYAMKISKRPELKTPLFHVPLPNVYQDCKVCMGDVKKPKDKIEITELLEAWEKAFWGSEFTQTLFDNGTEKILKQCIRKRKPFPMKDLKPTKKTLNSLL